MNPSFPPERPRKRNDSFVRIPAKIFLTVLLASVLQLSIARDFSEEGIAKALGGGIGLGLVTFICVQVLAVCFRTRSFLFFIPFTIAGLGAVGYLESVGISQTQDSGVYPILTISITTNGHEMRNAFAWTGTKFRNDFSFPDEDVSTIVDTAEKAAIRLDNRRKTFSKLPYTETERKLEQGTLTTPPGRLIVGTLFPDLTDCHSIGTKEIGGYVMEGFSDKASTGKFYTISLVRYPEVRELLEKVCPGATSGKDLVLSLVYSEGLFSESISKEKARDSQFRVPAGFTENTNQ